MEAVPVEWHPEQVARFWDYVSKKEDASSYFAHQVGRGVTRFLQYITQLGGLEVLDYGCGRGHMIGHLLREGAAVSAADSSQDSVQAVAAAYAGRQGFRGVEMLDGERLPWPESTFDVVTCLEMIEHVLPGQLDDILQEIARVLKKNGIAIFTTPNEEDLAANMICCPNCLSEFHRWQHVRSWSSDSLKSKLKGSGYETVFCQALDFERFQKSQRVPFLNYSLRHAWISMKRAMLRSLDHLFPLTFPQGRTFQSRILDCKKINLVAVARKQ